MTARCLEPMFPIPTTANFTISVFFCGHVPLPFRNECIVLVSGFRGSLYISRKSLLWDSHPFFSRNRLASRALLSRPSSLDEAARMACAMESMSSGSKKNTISSVK